MGGTAGLAGLLGWQGSAWKFLPARQAFGTWALAAASRNRPFTLSPHGPSQLPLPSPSDHSMAPVGQAVAQAGWPPHRLHLLALSWPCGRVKTVPNGQAMVHRWQPTQTSPSTTLA